LGWEFGQNGFERVGFEKIVNNYVRKRGRVLILVAITVSNSVSLPDESTIRGRARSSNIVLLAVIVKNLDEV
jgi:hypothetical protein